MVNTNAVLRRMDELGVKQKDIAIAWNCAQSTVSLKLRNKRPLLLDEAQKLQVLLQIRDEEFCSYFLSREVA